MLTTGIKKILEEPKMKKSLERTKIKTSWIN